MANLGCFRAIVVVVVLPAQQIRSIGPGVPEAHSARREKQRLQQDGDRERKGKLIGRTGWLME